MPTRMTLTELENLDARRRHLLKCERLLGFLNDAILPYSYAWTHPTRGEIGIRVEAVGLQDGDLMIRAQAGLTASGIPLLVASPLRFVNPPVRVQTGLNAQGMAVFAFRPLEAICQALAHTISLMPENPDHVALAPGDPTLTTYPDADPETTTVDGHTRRGGVNETFSTIRAGAGTANSSATALENCAQLTATTTTNQYSALRRSIYLFDTSSIASGNTISSATLSLYGAAKENGLGSPELDVVSSNPASNTTLVNADHATLGTTVYGGVVYDSFSTSAYNDMSLDSAAVTKAGITKLGVRLNWDTDNSFGGTWASGAASSFQAYTADQSGTTNDPKLVVVYDTARRRVLIAT